MKVTICVGSSCYVKGSRQIVEQIQKLIAENCPGSDIELAGAFCLGKCKEGVCVSVDGEYYSVTAETTEAFFREHILPKVQTNG